MYKYVGFVLLKLMLQIDVAKLHTSQYNK
jgi:hypothetical protein